MIRFSTICAVPGMCIICTLRISPFCYESLSLGRSGIPLLRRWSYLIAWLPRSSVGCGLSESAGRGKPGRWVCCMPCPHRAWSGDHCLRWGSPPGRWLRPMRQHAVFVSLRLLIRHSVPNLDRWSPSIDKSSSFMSPFRHKKLSWLLTKRQPVSSAIPFIFFIDYKTLLGSGNIVNTWGDAAESDTNGAGDPLCLVREFSDIFSYLFNRKFRCTIICSDVNGDVSVRISICFFKNFQDVTGFRTPSRYNIKSAGVRARDITNRRRAYEEIRHVSTWFCWMFWPITWKWWYLGQQSLVFNSKVLDRIHELGVTIQYLVHILL